MTTLFLTCLAIGGVVLVAQVALALIGLGADGHGDAAHGVHGAYDAHGAHGPSHDPSAGSGHGLAGRGPLEGLHLFSVRSLAAGVAFFGLGGLAALRLAAPAAVAVAAALVAGAAASVAAAWAMRALLRLEYDATARLDDAVGAAATVYVPVPASGGGPGKVLLTLRGRTVECQAVTSDTRPLPTGTAVTVVDVRAADLVEVVPTPSIDGVP